LAGYPGAEIALREFENGPPIDAPIALRIEGASLDTLHDIAARVERLLKTTPGTQYVTNPVRVARTDLRVAIDRAKAGLLGIPMLEIDRTVRLGIAGLEAGSLREGEGDARPVGVGLARGGAGGRDRGPVVELRWYRLRDHRRDIRDPGDPGARVPDLPLDADRCVGHSTRRRRRGPRAAARGADALIRSDDRVRRADRHRDQDVHPARGPDQPAAGGGDGSRGGDPQSRGGAFPANRAHQPDRNR